MAGSRLTWAQGAGKRLAVAGTGCGERARLVRRSARRVGHQRGVPQRGTADLSTEAQMEMSCKRPTVW